jgi:hypothetical protein
MGMTHARWTSEIRLVAQFVGIRRVLQKEGGQDLSLLPTSFQRAPNLGFPHRTCTYEGSSCFGSIALSTSCTKRGLGTTPIISMWSFTALTLAPDRDVRTDSAQAVAQQLSVNVNAVRYCLQRAEDLSRTDLTSQKDHAALILAAFT